MGIKVYRNGAWEERGGGENIITKEDLIFQKCYNLENLITKVKSDYVASVDLTLVHVSKIGYLDLGINFTLANQDNAWDTNQIYGIITVDYQSVLNKIGIDMNNCNLHGYFSTNGTKASDNYAIAYMDASYSTTCDINIIRTGSEHFTLKAGEYGFLRLQGFCYNYINFK